MPRSVMLSDARIAFVNQVISQAESVLRIRGLRDGDLAYFEDGPLALYGGRLDGGRARLAVEWHGEGVFDCYWPTPGDPGRLIIDQPGPWREALFGIRVLHS